MHRGWVPFWRKSKESDVFAHEGLWKLWSLCLMNANHKPQSVQVDGSLKPVMVQRGQFITGRYQLHGEYHQWSRGYKKRKPSARTLWRWLHTLQGMGMITIRSSNKYSLVTIINWDKYQARSECSTEVFHENQGKNANFGIDSEEKSQKLTTRKRPPPPDFTGAYNDGDIKTDHQVTSSRPSGVHKQECINNYKEYITQDVEAIYAAYPKKADKKNSIKSITKLIESGVPPKEILAAVNNYKTYIERESILNKYVINSKNFFSTRWQDYEEGSNPQAMQTGGRSSDPYKKCPDCGFTANSVDLDDEGGLIYCPFCSD